MLQFKAIVALGVALCAAMFVRAISYKHLRSHSLYPPYVDAEANNRYWDFAGSTLVDTYSYVRLTPNQPAKHGVAWTKEPLDVKHWQVEFQFKVTGTDGNWYGDGFAFWFTKEGGKLGPVFGGVDQFTGLGVFFDSYKNRKSSENFPLVYGMVGDGKTNFDHEGDGAAHRIGSCSAQYRNRDHLTRAKISYMGGMLEVKLNLEGEGTWLECFKAPVDLPSGCHIGFSAKTGQLFDTHDLIFVTTQSIEGVESKGTSGQQQQQYQQQQDMENGEHSGVSGIVEFIVLLVICAVVYFGYTMYRVKANKRF